MEIIEISSSPVRESSEKRAQLRRCTILPGSATDVIELTDSDDETPAAGASNPVSTSVQVGGPGKPDMLDPERAPIPGPSGRGPPLPARRPLFLPDSEDDMLSMAQPSRLVMQPTSAQASESSIHEHITEKKRDPLDAYISQVLEVVPDVLPEHARHLVTQRLDISKEDVVEQVLHILLEDPTYPKMDKKGKGKRNREDDDEDRTEANSKLKIDYGSKDREREGGPHYPELALAQLHLDYLWLPVHRIRASFRENNGLYAPTHLALLEDQKSGQFMLKRKAHPSRFLFVNDTDEELEKEKAWLRTRQQELGPSPDAAVTAKGNEVGEEEGGIECGCCFSSAAFEKMIQCPEAHLFCKSCMTSYASTLLATHDPNIICMDQSGCKLPFPESELQRFLSPKLLQLYERVKQRKEVEAAGLENLEECPFCEYKVVIENPQERLFRCENEDCGAVTCRECKKLDHLPKSCKEADKDKKLDAQHVVEEAMSEALIRRCPKCQKVFVKDAGCNKMKCSSCGTFTCYVCRKIITGYDHFDQTPPGHKPRSSSNKCPLWDSVEERHSNEVKEAAKKAVEEFKATHPGLNENDIKVDLPPSPVPGPSQARLFPRMDIPPMPNDFVDLPRHIFPPPIPGPPPVGRPFPPPFPGQDPLFYANVIRNPYANNPPQPAEAIRQFIPQDVAIPFLPQHAMQPANARPRPHAPRPVKRGTQGAAPTPGQG